MARSTGPERAELWRERLTRHSRSEQSTADFCLAEGVSVASFYAWRRKLGPATPRSLWVSPSAHHVPEVCPNVPVVATTLATSVPRLEF
ncbi:hypothetical protein Pla175_27290 [Pirellulimonas nuda]|uniref:Transposase n=1 Tax=Pirellulimonas nuda TaxID=2528009 RepID=A0A518DD04_9BACT|nr:hypothetical protein Pla175_27290 [Pirellulimonas nuda]